MTQLHGRGCGVAAVVVAVALVLAACGGAGTGEDSRVLRVAWCDPESLLPHHAGGLPCDFRAIRAIFDPLVDIDARTGEPVMVAARSVSSDDLATWRIELEPGRTFHDGEPVTAESFVDAWNYAAYGPNATVRGGDFRRVVGYEDLQQGHEGAEPVATEMAGLRVIDDLTFDVELAGPFGQFPSMLSLTPFLPLPSVAYEDLEAFADAPVGNGPFRVAAPYEPGVGVRLARYEDYGGAAPGADELDLVVYADPDTAFTDVVGGNLDVLWDVPAARLADAREEFGERLLEAPGWNNFLLVFPLNTPPYDEVDVRWALSMALDRAAIAERVGGGDLQPASSLVTRAMIEYREEACAACRYDPEAAATLFGDARPREPVGILIPALGSQASDTGAAIGNLWSRHLGLAYAVDTMSFPDLAERLMAGTVADPVVIRWPPSFPSAQRALDALFVSDGLFNSFGYANAEVDRLVARAEAAADPDQRTRLFQQAEDVILADLPMAPLFDEVDSLLLSKRVSVEPAPPAGVLLADLAIES